MSEAQRFGPFEVLGQIARGGQGAVLRARRVADGAPVALKLLLSADAKAVRRFRQEAQVLTRLERHPSIVRVLGHGEEQGVPWLAMELVEGQSLRALVEASGPPPFAFTVRTLEALARALARCHAQGIVHRDLKPENVIVEGGTGRPVLVDFGLLARDAEVFGELSIDALSRLSATGELRGTPAYMAPEQAAPARFGPVGPASDVHALGGTLFFLLTGAAPYGAGALPALIKRIIDEPAPDPRALNPSVPAGLAALCQRALAKRPDERPASMEAFARELAALQGECEAADARRGAAAPPPAPRPAPAPRPPSSGRLRPLARASAVRPGAVVGPYEVVEVLGQGGMGTVFRARHRALGAERALKVLGATNDPARRARFLREVQLLARTNHPNVVKIHEADTDGLACWFAMDLVEGEPLDRLLERGRPPLERALALAVAIARGVEALHALGIIHRDLKPQNVIVTPEGRPVVIDLGLAVDPERDERLTRTGAFVGTVRYMAPEQFSGKASERSDVYALGLIAFELITGRPALEGEGSVTELTARILTEERPRPGELDPALGANIDAAVAAACARDAERRPARAGAVAELLERAAREPGRPVGALRRRRRAGALLLGAAGLALAVALPRAERDAGGAVAPPAAVTSRPPTRPTRDELHAREEAARAAHELRAPDLAPAERLRRCDEWLARFGALGAPEHEEVLALRRAARREVPLLERVFARGREARALWIDGGARVLVWGRNHAVVALWSAEGEELQRFDLGAHALALEVLDDGRQVVVATATAPWLQRIDLAAGRVLPGPAPDPAPDGVVGALALRPDGRVIAVGDRGGQLRLLDLESGRELARAAAHRSAVRCLAFTPDGRRLVSGSGDWFGEAGAGDNALRAWGGDDLAPAGRGVTLASVPYFVRFAPDGRRFAVGISAYRLYLFDADDLERDPLELQGVGTEEVTAGLGSPTAHRGSVRAAAFLPGGRLVSVGGESSAVHGTRNELRAWDLAAGRELEESLRVLPDTPISVDAAPDGRVLLGFLGGAVQVLAPE